MPLATKKETGMKATKTTIFTALMVLSLTTALYAGEGRREGRHSKDGDSVKNGQSHKRKEHESRGKKMMKNLGLSEDQKEQVKDIHKAYKDKIKAAHKSMSESRKAFRKLSLSDDVNEAELRELSKKISDSMVELAVLKNAIRNEMKAVLTEDQQEKFKQKRAEMKERMKKRMKNRKQRRKHDDDDDDDDNDDD